MARLEKFSEKEFVDDITRLGGEALKQNASLYAKIPDRLCWLPIRNGVVWFWAEWKRDGEPPDYGQALYHKKLRNAGHVVYVFDNNRHAREIMRGLIGAI